MISLVIPAYNEEKRLPRSIQDFKSFFQKLNLDLEIIIVVEKSQDNTAQVAQSLTKDSKMFKIIANDVHLGPGYALKIGIDKAEGEYIFITDADIPIPLTYVLKFLEELNSNKDIDFLVGNRASGKVLNKNPFIRRVASKTYNFLVRNITGITVTDTQCAFKAFRKDTAKKIFTHIQTYNPAFCVEMFMLAKKFNFKYKEMPVTWVHSGGGFISYKNIIFHSIAIFTSMVKSFFRVKFLK